MSHLLILQPSSKILELSGNADLRRQTICLLLGKSVLYIALRVLEALVCFAYLQLGELSFECGIFSLIVSFERGIFRLEEFFECSIFGL